MWCWQVRKRLVAFQDGELAPGEQVRVEEHLDTCASCVALLEGLEAVTPRPGLQVPTSVQLRLDARIHAAIEAELDKPALPAARPWYEAWVDMVWGDVEVPSTVMLGYGALLAAVVGWGVSNYWAVQDLAEQLADQRIVPAEASISADQYRPAAYSSSDKSDPSR